MKELNGPISDKLRRLFTKDQILHNPRQPEAKPMPSSGVGGMALGGKPGRKGKRR